MTFPIAPEVRKGQLPSGDGSKARPSFGYLPLYDDPLGLAKQAGLSRRSSGVASVPRLAWSRPTAPS